MVFQRKYIFSFALTLLSVDNIAKFVSAFTRVFLTLFTKYNICQRTDSLPQYKGFMVAVEICCAGQLAEPTSETYRKGDVKCREFTKYNIRQRTDSLPQSKGFMVAVEICCAGKLAVPTSETYHKGDVKCREFSVVSDVNYWVKFCTTKQDIPYCPEGKCVG